MQYSWCSSSQVVNTSHYIQQEEMYCSSDCDIYQLYTARTRIYLSDWQICLVEKVAINMGGLSHRFSWTVGPMPKTTMSWVETFTTLSRWSHQVDLTESKCICYKIMKSKNALVCAQGDITELMISYLLPLQISHFLLIVLLQGIQLCCLAEMKVWTFYNGRTHWHERAGAALACLLSWMVNDMHKG